MVRTLLIIVLLSLHARHAVSAPVDRWLVQLNGQDTTCLLSWWQQNELGTQGYLFRKLPVDQWWVVEVPSDLSSGLKQLPCISTIYPDRPITLRKQPNDPGYVNQGDMNMIGMPKAWDVTTGGVTLEGDTIVVALLDDGYQIDHPDLVPNIWVNYGELDGDDIDNDGNGYTDDRFGYNVKTQNDQHASRTHGTSVAGIVGARGNNGTGVSGVNWNVKLLLVSGADFESSVIEAYQYVLDMRELYDETGGASGAFIVATNLSGGINYAFAADHPLWCEMYDKLGARGILSVTAAPNDPISVDEFGDMPTTCTSPYMIAVTNVDPSDVIASNAGYGEESIDLGAPGDGTLTTALGNQYKEFPGTSAAAPHVAGAVGLIYSTPCPDLLSAMKDDPSGTALVVKNLMLITAKPNNSLDEITVTGRRLQVDAAVKKTLEDCGLVGEGEISITTIRPNPARSEQVEVYFDFTGDITSAYYELYTITGARMGVFSLEFEDIERKFFQIDVGPLPAAMYLLTLKLDDQRITRKLVVY